MKWNTRRTKIFLINSKEECICPCCGSPLKYRDSRKRVHKIAGGGKEWYLIRRLRCSNDKCGRLHNELPDSLCPYKHYDAGLIEDVADGVAKFVTAHEVINTIEELTRDKTIIMIAHRLKTVRNADQILVIDKGTVAQKGTHKELLYQEGTYREFVQLREQAEGWRIQ